MGIGLFIISVAVVIAAAIVSAEPTSIPTSRPTSRPSSIPTIADTELAFFLLGDWGKSLSYGSRRKLSDRAGFFEDDLYNEDDTYIDNYIDDYDTDDTEGDFPSDSLTIPFISGMSLMQRDFKVVMANFNYWASEKIYTSATDADTYLFKEQLRYWYNELNEIATKGLYRIQTYLLLDDDAEATVSGENFRSICTHLLQSMEELIDSYPNSFFSTIKFTELTELICQYSLQLESLVFNGDSEAFSAGYIGKQVDCFLVLSSLEGDTDDCALSDDGSKLTQSYVNFYLKEHPDAKVFLRCPVAPRQSTVKTFEVQLAKTLSLQRDLIIICENIKFILQGAELETSDISKVEVDIGVWLKALDQAMASPRQLLDDPLLGDAASKLRDAAYGLLADNAGLSAFTSAIGAFANLLFDRRQDDAVAAFENDYKALFQKNCRLLIRTSDNTATLTETSWLPADFRHVNPGATASLECPYGVPVATISSQGYRKLANGGGNKNKKTINQLAIAAAMSRYADSTCVTAPKYVLSLGDNFYGNGVTSTTDSLWNYLWYNVYILPYKNLRVTWYPVFGNHDYGYQDTGTKAQIERYTIYKDPYWTMPAAFYSRIFAIPGDRNFTAYIVFIDTQTLAPDQNKANNANGGISSETQAYRISEQVAFIRTELQAAKAMAARWIIIVGHYPIVSQGEHGDISSLLTYVEPMLEQYGVDAYICGHDHIAEVLHYGETTHFVVGAGSMTDVLSSSFQTKAELMWSGVQYSSFGVMTVNEATLSVSFYDVNTTLRYNHTIAKQEPTFAPTYRPTSEPTLVQTIVSTPAPTSTPVISPMPAEPFEGDGEQSSPTDEPPSSQPTSYPTWRRGKGARSGGLQRAYEVMAKDFEYFMQQRILGLKASHIAIPAIVLLALGLYIECRKRRRARAYSQLKNQEKLDVECGKNLCVPNSPFSRPSRHKTFLVSSSAYSSNEDALTEKTMPETSQSERSAACSDHHGEGKYPQVASQPSIHGGNNSPNNCIQFKDINQSFNNILLNSNRKFAQAGLSPMNRHRRFNTNMT